MNIGNKIKSYRDKQNISQDDLALKVFVSRQTVSNWENSKSCPDIKSLALLCNVFGMTLDDFMKGDIEEMKKIINEESLKKFNFLGTIYTIELISLIISAYPLFRFIKIVGIVVWILLTIATLITAFTIEKFKKNNDIQTYKEIVAFCENRTLTHDEKQQEFGKRTYQKILLAIVTGLITFIVFILMDFIF